MKFISTATSNYYNRIRKYLRNDFLCLFIENDPLIEFLLTKGYTVLKKSRNFTLFLLLTNQLQTTIREVTPKTRLPHSITPLLIPPHKITPTDSHISPVTTTQTANSKKFPRSSVTSSQQRLSDPLNRRARKRKEIHCPGASEPEQILAKSLANSGRNTAERFRGTNPGISWWRGYSGVRDDEVVDTGAFPSWHRSLFLSAGGWGTPGTRTSRGI